MDKSVSILSDITVYSKYARYLADEKRRETWTEIVDRNKAMHLNKFEKLGPEFAQDIENAYKPVYSKQVLPSMRSVQFAGTAIDVNPVRIYNCSYRPAHTPSVFWETMFLLLSGTGVGYSVQQHHVEQLPSLKIPKTDRRKRYLIPDSIEGWAEAVRVLMESYFKGKSEIDFDFRAIRPKGAILITSGGKAPGPEPLKAALLKIKQVLDTAILLRGEDTLLTSLEVHDILCHEADAVLAGGIRRAAMISLFSKEDSEMLNAKGHHQMSLTGFERIDADKVEAMIDYKGKTHNTILSNWDLQSLQEKGTLPWYVFEPQRGRANNSVVLERDKITKGEFIDLWTIVEASNAGEPGFAFTNNKEWGLNPCAEISLKPYQFCNLVTMNASTIENQEDLNKRSQQAAFIATLQASYTNFHYLGKEWQDTTEEEALIGVSMTGIASGTLDSLDLAEAARKVKEENEQVADIIGINKAARVTAIKPEGTASLVVGTSSGIHAWHNDYYIRRIRVGKNEALYNYLNLMHPELVEDDHFNKSIAIISVPQKAPAGAALRNEDVLHMLNRVHRFNKEWVQEGHRDGDNFNNVSCTVSIRNNEWEKVGEWMWNNREDYTAISVLPLDDHNYIQAPYEDITDTFAIISETGNRTAYSKKEATDLVFDVLSAVAQESNLDSSVLDDWSIEKLADALLSCSLVSAFSQDKEVKPAKVEFQSKEDLYEQLLLNLESIDLSTIQEDVDNTDLSAEAACSGGNCEVTEV